MLEKNLQPLKNVHLTLVAIAAVMAVVAEGVENSMSGTDILV